MPGVLKSLPRLVYIIESGLLILLLLTIIGLSFTDILLRNFFNSGLTFAPPVVRALVLWLGLLGALYATRDNKHITIDVLARLLPLKMQTHVKGFTSLFATIVCSVIAWHGFIFVYETHFYSDTVFGNTPAWLVQLVIPVSFLLIGIRFLVHGLRCFFVPVQPEKQRAKQP